MESGVDLHFYEIAAQVIPVLLLIMVIGDSRFRVTADDSAIFPFLYLFVVVTLTCGEIASLAVVANGSSTALASHVTRFGLAFGVTYVVVDFCEKLLTDLGESASKARQNTYEMFAAVTFLAVLVIALVLIRPPY